jgi:hypothetical protein
LPDAASDPSVTLYVTSQILCEFYFDRHQPAPGEGGFFFSGSTEHNFVDAGPSRSVRVADPGPRGCGMDATAASATRSPGETYSIYKSSQRCRPTEFSEFTGI